MTGPGYPGFEREDRAGAATPLTGQNRIDMSGDGFPMKQRPRGVATQVATSGAGARAARVGRAGGRIVVRLTIDKEVGYSDDARSTAAFRSRARVTPIPGAYSLEVSSPGSTCAS